MAPSRVLALAVALSVLSLGCGDDDDGAAQGDSGFGPLAVVEGPPSGDDALIQGELSIDEDCVVLIEDGEPVLIVWPSEGTTWDSETETIRYDDGETDDDEPEVVEMADGDTVRFGGGGFSESESGQSYDDFVASIDWLQEPAEECTASVVWFAG